MFYWAPVRERLSGRRCAARRQVVTMATLWPLPTMDDDPAPPPRHAPSFSVLPASYTKRWEACEHPCPDLADDTRLLMLLHVLIVVVLSRGGPGGKPFISGFVSSVDPCVICGLVLLITRANQTFTNLLMRSELCLGVVDHILSWCNMGVVSLINHV
jgi:hypothetical protein